MIRKPSINAASFGKCVDGFEATLNTLTNCKGMLVDVSDRGATLVRLDAPGRDESFHNRTRGTVLFRK